MRRDGSRNGVGSEADSEADGTDRAGALTPGVTDATEEEEEEEGLEQLWAGSRIRNGDFGKVKIMWI